MKLINFKLFYLFLFFVGFSCNELTSNKEGKLEMMAKKTEHQALKDLAKKNFRAFRDSSMNMNFNSSNAISPSDLFVGLGSTQENNPGLVGLNWILNVVRNTYAVIKKIERSSLNSEEIDSLIGKLLNRMTTYDLDGHNFIVSDFDPFIDSVIKKTEDSHFRIIDKASLLKEEAALLNFFDDILATKEDIANASNKKKKNLKQSSLLYSIASYNNRLSYLRSFISTNKFKLFDLFLSSKGSPPLDRSSTFTSVVLLGLTKNNKELESFLKYFFESSDFENQFSDANEELFENLNNEDLKILSAWIIQAITNNGYPDLSNEAYDNYKKKRHKFFRAVEVLNENLTSIAMDIYKEDGEDNERYKKYKSLSNKLCAQLDLNLAKGAINDNYLEILGKKKRGENLNFEENEIYKKTNSLPAHIDMMLQHLEFIPDGIKVFINSI